MGSLRGMALGKFAEMTKNLPPEKKAKLDAIDFTEIAEIFVNMFGLDSYMDAAVKLAAQSKSAGDGDKSEGGKSSNQQKKQADDDDDDADEEEIDADETKKSKIKEDL